MRARLFPGGALLLGMFPSNAAHAETTSTEAVVLGGVAIEAGESYVMKEEEVTAAREDAVAGETAVPAAEERAIAREVADIAAEQGGYVHPGSVDVVPLLDGDVILGVPENTEVASMTIAASADATELTATLETNESHEVPAATTAGPSMALEWGNDGQGSYVIKILQGGDLKIDGRFTWRRRKLLGDGQPNKVHYAYQRFGDAQPSSQTGPDPRIVRLRIQNFPYDSVEPHLLDWDRYQPASDRGDNCTSYPASISYGGLSLSVPFNEGCGEYNMWRNVDKPSSYWLQYESGGVNPSGGNKEVGYVIMWSQKQGTPGSQHDVQQIRLGWPAYYWGAYETCTQTDASRTC